MLMKKTLFLLSLVGLLALPSCRKDKPFSGCRSLAEEKDMPQDALLGLSAELDDDCLRLAVSFGGGCKDHDFDLYWDGTSTRSYPPQVTLELLHDDHGDDCKAIRVRKLSFDLSSLREKVGDSVSISVKAAGVERIWLGY
jgi:hypothetical protein